MRDNRVRDGGPPSYSQDTLVVERGGAGTLGLKPKAITDYRLPISSRKEERLRPGGAEWLFRLLVWGGVTTSDRKSASS